MRIYFKPKIIKNISDNHDWTIVKDKKVGLVCDAIKPMKFGFWKSKFPSPIYEPIEHWSNQ